MLSSEVSTFDHLGWRFQSFRGPIASASELARLSHELGLGNIPLPEETYARSFIGVTNERLGVAIRIDALGSLRNWHERQTKSHPNPSVLSFDWTYSCEYGGAFSREGDSVGPPDLPDTLLTAEVYDASRETAVSSFWLPHALGLPITRLAQREPILYFAEIILYAGQSTAPALHFQMLQVGIITFA
jgi:hypothetical protein